MTTFADPRRCPDCRTAFTTTDTSCPGCGLPLRGETAQRLYVTLREADRLLGVLRGEAPARTAPATTEPSTAHLTPYPAAPQPAPAGRTRRGLSARSVPVILLTLGAGCLVVAALVFLAVTWTLLGVAGRTTVLVLLTGVAAVLAIRMVRSGLRGAAEALSTVAYALLTFDVLGADHAGWLGDLSTWDVVLLVGTTLFAAGALGALAASRSGMDLAGAQSVVVLGTALATGALAAGPWLPLAPGLVVGVLLSAAVASVAWAGRLRVLTLGAVALTAAWWGGLTFEGLFRTVAHDGSWASLWGGLEVWPLLVSAALVAAVAAVGRLPMPVRVAAAAAAHTLLVVAALAPAATLPGRTSPVLVTLGVLAATALVTAVLPRPWGLVNVLTQAAAASLTLAVVAELGRDATDRLAQVVEPVWAGRWTDALPPQSGHGPAAWLLPLSMAALLLTTAALLRAVPAPPRLSRVARAGAVATVAAATLVLTLALYPVPVWLALATLLAAAVGSLAWWLLDDSSVALALGLPFGALALTVSLHAQVLTGACLAVALAHAVVVQLSARRRGIAVAAAGWSALLVAASAWTWGTVAGAPQPWTALVGIALPGAAVLLAPYLPDGWWRGPATEIRTGLEAGAAVAAATLGVAGVVTAPPSTEASWTAVYLTLTGAVVTVMSLLRTDRARLGWAGGLLLAAASWVRLYDVGVHAPEAYTLPSAAVLVLVGWRHLRRDRSATTTTALLPGLSLATVPTLLWVLVDPTGWRPLLLGLAALALVLAGVRLRWTAPLVVGAVVGALLVLRLVAPYEHAVPRWILIGGAGAVLVVIGASWERRLADARQVAGYVRGLR